MRRLVGGFRYPAAITVDAVSACVSFEMNRRYITFSVFSGHPILFVKVKGLPPTFIEVPMCALMLKMMTQSLTLTTPI